MTPAEKREASRVRGRNALRWRKTGMTYREIAERLGVGTARAKQIVETAHRREWCRRPIGKMAKRVLHEMQRASIAKRNEARAACRQRQSQIEQAQAEYETARDAYRAAVGASLSRMVTDPTVELRKRAAILAQLQHR